MTESEPKPKRTRVRKPVPHAGELELVMVAWIDAAFGDYDGSPKGYDKNGLCNNVSAGFLLRQNKRELVLMIDVEPNDDTVRWPYTIPTSLVLNVLHTGIYAKMAIPTKGD